MGLWCSASFTACNGRFNVWKEGGNQQMKYTMKKRLMCLRTIWSLVVIELKMKNEQPAKRCKTYEWRGNFLMALSYKTLYFNTEPSLKPASHKMKEIKAHLLNLNADLPWNIAHFFTQILQGHLNLVWSINNSLVVNKRYITLINTCNIKQYNITFTPCLLCTPAIWRIIRKSL